MDFSELQLRVKQWGMYNFPKAEAWQPLIGAMEELGELSHAHLKEFQNIRKDNFKKKKEDAIGDIIIFLADYCNRSGLVLDSCVFLAWKTASKRDWKTFPFDGISR